VLQNQLPRILAIGQFESQKVDKVLYARCPEGDKGIQGLNL